MKCECVRCCKGEHAGYCRECAGCGETPDGGFCYHCDGAGVCPVCNGHAAPIGSKANPDTYKELSNG
jgi:hypothetical protein